MEKAKYRCPISKTLSVVGGKWKPLILWQLQAEPRRFNQLKSAIEDITQKMLTQQLRELEADGLINRQAFMEMPLRVEYSLTEQGRTLFPVLQAMAEWGYAQGQGEFSLPLSQLEASPLLV